MLSLQGNSPCELCGPPIPAPLPWVPAAPVIFPPHTKVQLRPWQRLPWGKHNSSTIVALGLRLDQQSWTLPALGMLLP